MRKLRLFLCLLVALGAASLAPIASAATCSLALQPPFNIAPHYGGGQFGSWSDAAIIKVTCSETIFAATRYVRYEADNFLSWYSADDTPYTIQNKVTDNTTFPNPSSRPLGCSPTLQVYQHVFGAEYHVRVTFVSGASAWEGYTLVSDGQLRYCFPGF